ncbi:hypothetical protein B0H17DRAFT_1141607 [Mycena rosella]|uniref:Uncharacterized protein n=1 Tax=Mycena rosella TaxID=1033263 RepID=A0AAD7GAD5_MYCRO|nr:hypothetical protein B0H17DRAFT_1141607 [Mycena rosella]
MSWIPKGFTYVVSITWNLTPGVAQLMPNKIYLKILIEMKGWVQSGFVFGGIGEWAKIGTDLNVELDESYKNVKVPDQDIPLFGWGGTVAAGLMRMTHAGDQMVAQGRCQKRTGRVNASGSDRLMAGQAAPDMYDGGPGMQSHHTHCNFLFGMVHLPPSGGTRWVII